MNFTHQNKTLRASLTILLCLAGTIAWSQERHKRLILTGGPAFGYIQDRHAAPVAYVLQGMRYGLSFNYQGNKSYWLMSLVVTKGHIAPRYLNSATMNLQWPDDIFGKPAIEQVSYREDYIDAQLNIQYLLPIRMPDRWKLWIGPGLKGSVTYTEMSRYFWPLSVNGVMLGARTSYKIFPRHQIASGVSAYVLGYVSRFHYESDPSLPNTTLLKSFFKEDTDFRALNDLQHIDFELSYQYQLQNRINIGIQYTVDWLSIQTPRPLRKTQSNYQAIISFTI